MIMANNNATYWATTDVLGTYMGLVYTKVQKMVDKKILELSNGISNINQKAEQVYADLNNFTAVITNQINNTKDAAESSIQSTKDAAESSIQSTKDAAESSIQSTKDAADASYNTYANLVYQRTQDLQEYVLTQEEYDALFNEETYDENTGNTITTARGDTIQYVKAVITPAQLVTLKTNYSVTSTYEGSEITWTLNTSTNVATSNEATPRYMNVDTMIGTNAFATYYIVEE